MAIFNPDVPNARVSDPNWTNVSRPISDVNGSFIPDKSTATAIGATSDILTSATKAVDFDIKESAKKDVQQGVDNLRDAYTDSLKAIRNVQLASADASLLPDSTAPAAPQGLENGIARAKTIGTAMAQNGAKINDTLYTGALNSLAKQLRSQYPGYRDYIDEQIQSVSGVNPANAFMKNLMEDINRSQENNKTEMNATMSTLRSNADNGFHDGAGVKASDIYSLVKAGVLTPDKAMSWLNSAKSIQYDTKMKADARASRLGDEADAVTSATKDLSSTAAKTIAHNWTTMTLGKGTDTAEGLFNFIQQNQGNQGVMDERSQAIGQQLVALRNQTAKQLMAQANEGGANSLVAKLGGDPNKAKAVIDGQLATFDMAIQAVFHKDWGAAYSHMNFNKAISQDSTNILYNATDEDVRKYNRMVGAINNISPQFGLQFFKDSLLGPVPKAEKEFLKNTKMELLTQPDAPTGKLTSIQGALNDAKSRGVRSPKTYDEMINTVNDIGNPRLGLEHRLNLAEAFFNNTANAGLLADKNFKKDYYDETLKREIPGKYVVFRKLTSDNVASGINELAKTNPEIKTKYQTMLSREFGEQLFSRELRDLGEVNERNMTYNTPYKIKFSDDAKRPPHFEVVNPDGTPMTMGQAIMMEAPVRSLNRLNEGMSSLWGAYKGTGVAEPGNEVMKQVYRYNYHNPESSPQGRVESLSGTAKAIWNAIMSANSARLKEQGELMRK